MLQFLAVTPPPPKFVYGPVVGDTEQPGGCLPPFRFVRRHPPPHVKKYVLRDLFRRTRISEHVHSQRIDRARIPVV